MIYIYIYIYISEKQMFVTEVHMVPVYQNCRYCWTSTIFWTEFPSSETSPRKDRRESAPVSFKWIDASPRKFGGPSRVMWKGDGKWKGEGILMDFDQNASDICKNMVRNHAFNRKYGDLIAFSHTCWILASWATQKMKLCVFWSMPWVVAIEIIQFPWE